MVVKITYYLKYILLILVLSGCAGLNQVEDRPAAVTNTPGETAGDFNSSDNGYMTDSNLEDYPGDSQPTVTGETSSLVLYFATEDGKLAAVRRVVPKTTAVARQAMVELCRGPEANSGLLPTMPQGTALRDINIRDGVANVDFSAQLKSGHWGGSSGELLTVYSIVNTLTQYRSIERVQILVEGEPIDTLSGHLDTSKPLERDGTLIKALIQ